MVSCFQNQHYLTASIESENSPDAVHDDPKLSETFWLHSRFMSKRIKKEENTLVKIPIN